MNKNKMKSKVIGLTGGIASGKTTMANILKKNGFNVIDADKVGHEVYKKNTPTYENILGIFGKEILNEKNEINRKILGSIVFSDPNKMNQLNQLVWPEIGKIIKKEIDTLQLSHLNKSIIIEAAVLIEANWVDVVDEIWLVYCQPKTAIKRLMKRNHLSELEAMNRISSQLSNEQKLAKVNFSIANDDSLEIFEKKIFTECIPRLLS